MKPEAFYKKMASKKGNRVEYSTFISWGKDSVIGHNKIEENGKNLLLRFGAKFVPNIKQR